ncbi:MAG: adenylosuccinate synthetase [Methanobacteriota archaeon]|nr:MAG: adenylosuccinate synthetase [Euryarchaeota archaeon]
MVTILVGGQWGDEGKGKIVSYLCLNDRYDVTARAGVGPNAGHTVEYKGKKYGLRLTPSGFLTPGTRLLIGAGVLVDPQVILKEIRELDVGDRIGIDRRCGIIEEEHIRRDRGSSHLKEKIGSTGTGCGPANMDRANRSLRLAGDVPELKPYMADVPKELNSAIEAGKKVLVEGSQGFGLSLYYGTYPYVTSKDTNAAQACVDVGIGPRDVKEVIVVFKSYPSRVGEGPFPTELSPAEAEKQGIVEYGTVTGRRRRTGTFDFDMAREAAMINSASQIALTCVDYIDKTSRGAKRYEDLTERARRFVDRVEKEVGVPVTLISTGPDLSETIDLREEKL